ncbi:MAG: hypothetical protein RR978_01040 [Oscillospiraceae bacterium]
MDNLLILGAGGYGRVIREAAIASGLFADIAFLDDAVDEAIGTLNEFTNFLDKYPFAYPALGNNMLRCKWLTKLENAGFKLPVIIHPRAYVSPTAVISGGTAVLANATVCANAVIGKGVIINVNAVADHDCHLYEGVHLAPGAIVKARCIVEKLAKVDSGEVVTRV